MRSLACCLPPKAPWGLSLEQRLLGEGAGGEDSRAWVDLWDLGLRFGQVVNRRPRLGWAQGAAAWQGARVTGTHPLPAAAPPQLEA